MSRSVIITGALGFIGAHTAKVFKEAGCRVIGIDRHCTIPEAAKYLDHWIMGDFADFVATTADLEKVGVVVHCAGTSLVGPSIGNPGEYYSNNVAKTNQMLVELSDWRGIIVFSSSAATYGNKCTSPIPETAPTQPINPYGWSKLMCEQVIQDHCQAHQHRGVILRYFNAAGADADVDLGHVADDTHMIPRVLSAHQRQEPFTLYGDNYNTRDGTCIRDYLHVTDIAQAHLEAVRLAHTMTPGESRIYNLGTGRGHTNQEIVAGCSRVVGAPITYQMGDPRAGDPDELVADSTAFQSATPWRPVNSDIENIISTAWNWQKRYNVLP